MEVTKLRIILANCVTAWFNLGNHAFADKCLIQYDRNKYYDYDILILKK